MGVRFRGVWGGVRCRGVWCLAAGLGWGLDLGEFGGGFGVYNGCGLGWI